MIKYAPCMLALILITGCGDASTQTSAPISPLANAEFSTAAAPGLMITNDPAWQDKLDDTQELISYMHNRLNDYKAGSISLNELHASARQILEDNADKESIFVPIMEQNISHRMLHTLLQAADYTDCQEPVAYHTEVLIRNKSPEVAEVSQALEVLDGYWTEDRIRSTAEKAIQHAEAWLVEHGASIDDNDEDQSGLRKQHMSDKARISAGLVTLEKMTTPTVN